MNLIVYLNDEYSVRFFVIPTTDPLTQTFLELDGLLIDQDPISDERVAAVSKLETAYTQYEQHTPFGGEFEKVVSFGWVN